MRTVGLFLMVLSIMGIILATDAIISGVDILKKRKIDLTGEYSNSCIMKSFDIYHNLYILKCEDKYLLLSKEEYIKEKGRQ